MSEADSYLDMASSVPLTSLLKTGSKAASLSAGYIDLWKATEVEPFFLSKVKTTFPAVYRVALKYLPRAVSTCFQVHT